MKPDLHTALLLFLAIGLSACDAGSGENGNLIITDLEEGTGLVVEPGMTLITTYVGGLQTARSSILRTNLERTGYSLLE